MFDRTARRIYVTADLTLGAEITLTDANAHYVLNVLRQAVGDSILFFNGKEGEWRGIFTKTNKKFANYRLEKQLREQPASPTLTFAFAPLKKERLDYMVQKAVEMGAGVLLPVFTQYTQNHRLEKCEIYAIEAAEQCGILSVPRLEKALQFKEFIESYSDKLLVFCDEQATISNPLEALKGHDLKEAIVFIGPEGGFSEEERTALLALPKVIVLSLGKNILRADTAAVAAMALIGAMI